MSAAKSRILYLGLRAKSGVFHYPVIRTKLACDPKIALAEWPQLTHMIFTSQTAVEYWEGPWDKEVLAIGPSTAAALREKGVESKVAPFATQEGLIALIREIDGYFFFPRSKKARPLLTDFMQQNGIPFLALDLYDTLFQKLEPVPNLDDFDEIIFTSPSTVEGFLRIYGKLPEGKKTDAHWTRHRRSPCLEKSL